MFVGKRVKAALCRFVALRQKAILRKISKHFGINPTDIGFQIIGKTVVLDTDDNYKYRLVRSILQMATPADFQQMRIDRDSFCLKHLENIGTVLERPSQVTKDHAKFNDLVQKLIGISDEEAKPRADSKDIFEQYVAWARDHPGQFFNYKRLEDRKVRFAGLFANKLIVFRRTTIEQMSMAKYFPLGWKRQQPLWSVFKEEGTMSVRAAGVWEVSNVRANEAPYCDLHGMSLPGGTYELGEHNRKYHEEDARAVGRGLRGKAEGELKKIGQDSFAETLRESQWVWDPKANLSNWYFTDIEKILNESWQLNPHASKSDMLPWEGFVNVGQNPKVGSSIQKTQHTQLTNGSVKKYPVFGMSTNPR